MANVLVISHGLLAQELCNTVVMITGPDASLNYVSLDAMQGVERLKMDLIEKIKELVKDGQKVLIICDVFGGCPFNTVSEYMNNNFEPQQYKIISGANLPMLLELCMANNLNPDNLDYLVDLALRMGREGIIEFVMKSEKNSLDEVM